MSTKASSLDDAIMESSMASVGPSVPPPPQRSAHSNSSSGDARADAVRKTTQAWIDEKAAVAAASGTASKPPLKRKPTQRLALAIVLLQTLWAVFVPIKNVATMFYPTIRPDTTRTTASAYSYAHEQPQMLAGSDLVPLLRDVLEITLGNDVVHRELVASGSLDINRLWSIVSLDNLAKLSQYYALVLQSSEFPGGVFTPRSFAPALASAKLSLVLRRTAATSPESNALDNLLTLDLACSKERAFLQATRCTGADGFPCPGDYPQPNEQRTFEDVDLQALAANSGLQNNVGLLFVVEFFQQAMSAVFATRDWTTTLERLQFVQATDAALRTGSLSAFHDNMPFVAEEDAFLVAVQAAAMETTQLDSCIASELIVGQFYTRTFVLAMIQSALTEFELFGFGDDGGRATPPAIVVPPNTDAVLAPMFAFDLHVTSGAQFGSVDTAHTHFLEHIRVATQRIITLRVKRDHAFNTAMQTPGSSMRMLQYMAFFPDLASTFTSTTHTSSSSADGDDDAFDVQTYKLLGATRAGVNMFKEPSTGANSWMVFPLAEVGTAERPVSIDAWWDDEVAAAAWFQALESQIDTAPFRVFDAHLKITSDAHRSPVDDNSTTRCHRALFKVLAKIVYLALVDASKPATYLMFMADVASDHHAWLLARAFIEELVADNFFGDRVAFPYRNGPFTRKDDGSAWVIIPLLHAMRLYLGDAATRAVLFMQLDRSFAGAGGFVRVFDGDVHFPDASYCHIDGIGANQTVTQSDSVEEAFVKLAPGLEASIDDLLALVPSVQAAMQHAMAAQHVTPVELVREQIVGSSVVSASTERLGSPIDWQPSALTAGLRKLWPPKTPLRSTVTQLRAATQCYRMLELRFLNVTTRCFAAPESIELRRRATSAEAMRAFFLSLWTLDVMLNTIASVIVLKYLEKLRRAWRVTQFECLDVEAALQLNIQGIGVLNISQSLLLLVAALPSLLSFHVPTDTLFMPHYGAEQLPKPLIDLCVTLSMSWFLKISFEVCTNYWLTPRRPADALYQFRLRWLLLTVIFVVRLFLPRRPRDGAFLMWTLVLTCVVSLLLGACTTAVIFFPERRGKVASSDHKASHDAVLAALVKQNLPLNRYGVLGRTSKGWSKTGLLVAGWKVARTDASGDQVLRKGAGEILLPPETYVDSTDSADRVDKIVRTSESEIEGSFVGGTPTTTVAPIEEE